MGVNTNYWNNVRTQTDGIGKSSNGTSMKRVEYGTMGTNTFIGNNMMTQSQQIQQSEVGTNTNSAFNNFTQTTRPIKNLF